MAKKQKAQATEGPADDKFVSGLIGYILGGILGLLALLGLSKLLTTPPEGPIQELPHLAVLIQLDGSLADAEVRRELVALHRELEDELDLAVQGPADFAILVPGPERGDRPEVVPLEELTDAQWEAARPYVERSGWFVDRVYTAALDEVLFRIAPKRGPFLGGTGGEVDAILERRAGLGRAFTYSRALGWEDEEARAAINLRFGVQTAHVLGRSTQDLNGWEHLAPLRSLFDVPERNERIRSLVLPLHFAHYALAVLRHEPDLDLDAVRGAPWGLVAELAAAADMPRLVSEDGHSIVLEVGTTAEGEANLETCYWVAANAEQDTREADVNFIVPRERKQASR